MRNSDTSSWRSRRHRPTSTTGVSEPFADVPECGLCIGGTVIMSVVSFLFYGFIFHDRFHLDLFIDSIAVSSSSGSGATAPAEWNVRFLVKTPITGLNFDLNMLQARLLRREKSLSTADMDSFRRKEMVDDRPVATTAFFNTTALEAVGDDGTVVWDFSIEAIAGLKPDSGRWREDGYLIVTCEDLPVRFWTDPTKAAAVRGSLFGKMRQCDYSFRKELPSRA